MQAEYKFIKDKMLSVVQNGMPSNTKLVSMVTRKKGALQ